jgi:hypothetical protein
LRKPFIVREQVQNYHKVLGSITKETDLDYCLYSLDSSTFNYYQDHGMIPSALLAAKVEPLLAASEMKYGLSDKIVQLGSIFQAIKDDELRNRCADILTAVSHFDRVITKQRWSWRIGFARSQELPLSWGRSRQQGHCVGSHQNGFTVVARD